MIEMIEMIEYEYKMNWLKYKMIKVGTKIEQWLVIQKLNNG